MMPAQLLTTFSGQTYQLAEFISSLIYCMWHTRKNVVNNMWQSYSPLYSTASPEFKKFCYQVLAATQLKDSVVYLSLKYMTILLKSNPSIEGAEGSEYRLFIVALMLANKFLDDHTFTNKTWSDVSGMKVHDLNIMEMEFLEALDYNLFISEHEFKRWKQVLEECHYRMVYYHSNPQAILSTLGLYQDHTAAIRLQFENAYKRYQQFIQPTNTTTNNTSWDPLTYQIYQPILSWGTLLN